MAEVHIVSLTGGMSPCCSSIVKVDEFLSLRATQQENTELGGNSESSLVVDV